MSVLRVLIFLSFLLGAPAFAQFEIAPDHFGSVETPPANQVKAHQKIKAVQTAVIARQDRGGLLKAVRSQKQAVNAGSRKSGGKTSVASRRKPALKTRTISVLQPIRRSQ